MENLSSLIQHVNEQYIDKNKTSIQTTLFYVKSENAKKYGASNELSEIIRENKNINIVIIKDSDFGENSFMFAKAMQESLNVYFFVLTNDIETAKKYPSYSNAIASGVGILQNYRMI